MGYSPNSAGVSLRTFNRNFEGRSGTADGQVYLVSPETAVASALTGYITDPTTLGKMPAVHMPKKFFIDDSAVIPPVSEEEAENIEVLRGPNIKPFPESNPVTDEISAECVLKVGDNITTDHIMPAGAKILPYRSNIPHLAQFCFGVCDKTFPERAKKAGQSIIIGGSNYGQGSSREHAALVPLYLGVRAVIAKSFARIHAANLINAGIMPLVFEDPSDYTFIGQGDMLILKDIFEGMEKGSITLADKTTKKEYSLKCFYTQRQKEILKAGGLLQYTKMKG
jgi:aconitate hydratase